LKAGAGDLAARLGIDAPLTIYQSHSSGEMNASLAYIPSEVHLVLHGPVLTALSPLELDAVLAHELSHFLLYHKWDGDFVVTSEVVRALAGDGSAETCHRETARLLRLYEEIYADRGSLLVTGDLTASVAALIKLHTGLPEVSVESYFRQAEEIFSTSRESSNQLSHPEPYIRARALQLWQTHSEAAELEISRMIEGRAALDTLDLIGRRNMAQSTRRLISRLLAPRWLHTELLLSHARQFFDDFAAGEEQPVTAGGAFFDDDIGTVDASLIDYFCYVLLDFAVADQNIHDLALSAAFVTSRQVGMGSRFSEIAAKELGLPKKRFAKLEAGAEWRVAEAMKEASEQLSD
jgi:hypothetical protein